MKFQKKATRTLAAAMIARSNTIPGKGKQQTLINETNIK